VTDAVECRREAAAEPPADAESAGETDSESTPTTDPDSERVAAEIERRAERVARQERDAALRKLDARGDLTPDQRQVVAALSASLADQLVAQWTAGLAREEDTVDPTVARDLLVE